MTPAQDLLALAARVEMAEGPDRELDAAIACAHRGLTPVVLVANNERYGDICDRSDSGFGSAPRVTPGLCYARFPDELNPPTLGGGKRGNIVQGFTPARYTASLDAAMKLVPEDATWSAVGKGAAATCYPPAHLRQDDVSYISKAATPALALVAAALRARAAA